VPTGEGGEASPKKSQVQPYIDAVYEQSGF